MGGIRHQMKKRYYTLKSIGRYNAKNLKEGDYTKIIFCKCPLCSKLKIEPTYGDRFGHKIYSYCIPDCLHYVRERESSSNFIRK